MAAVAAVSVVVAGGVVLVRQATDADDPDTATTAPDAEPHGRTGPAEEPPPDDGEEARLVPIEGTDVSVPGRAEGFGPPVPGRWPTSEGDAPEGHYVTYDKPGPLEGTIAGSLTVSVHDDPDLAGRLADLESPNSRVAVATTPGHDPRQASVVRAGDRLVLRIRGTDVVPAPDPAYEDRVYTDYLFATTDGTDVVQVVTDALSDDDVLAFVSRIRG